jgi:hypothetical protein
LRPAALRWLRHDLRFADHPVPSITISHGRLPICLLRAGRADGWGEALERPLGEGGPLDD